jgi:BirA family biotin operon repressor/biotin-[acetyl-CoA-carboxylase] ligase
MKEKQLYTPSGECRMLVYDHLPSTNKTAREMAADGATDGTVIIAHEQSAGRGRLQRSFFSPGGTGLYMSLILRRDLPAAHALHLTPMAAVATAEAIESIIGRKVDIKWVNDIYMDNKKVCGILTEGAMDPQTQALQYAVVGIGVNVAPPEGGFPEELRHIAGAILPKSENAAEVRDALAQRILSNLMTLLEERDPASAHTRYRSRLVLLGYPITVHTADGSSSRVATALDIDEDYRLIVRYEDGSIEHLDSGEVSVRL